MCDGVTVEVPAGVEGIIFLNINSYGGGVQLWDEEGSIQVRNMLVERASWSAHSYDSLYVKTGEREELPTPTSDEVPLPKLIAAGPQYYLTFHWPYYTYLMCLHRANRDRTFAGI
jgi:hypothetical protein